jgi:hypothetical protein
MKKAIAASIVVLMTGSGALAAIGDIGQQAQTWDLGISAGVILNAGGQATATNIQGIGLLSGQTTTTADGASASQLLGAALFQTYSVANQGARVTANGTIDVDALALTASNGTVFGPGQEQIMPAYVGTAVQFEGLQVGATQVLTKDAGGLGTAEGTNLVGVGVLQSGSNISVDMGEGALILGGQHSELDGITPGSGGSVSTAIAAQIVQIQAAN